MRRWATVQGLVGLCPVVTDDEFERKFRPFHVEAAAGVDLADKHLRRIPGGGSDRRHLTGQLDVRSDFDRGRASASAPVNPARASTEAQKMSFSIRTSDMKNSPLIASFAFSVLIARAADLAVEHGVVFCLGRCVGGGR